MSDPLGSDRFSWDNSFDVIKGPEITDDWPLDKSYARSHQTLTVRDR